MTEFLQLYAYTYFFVIRATHFLLDNNYSWRSYITEDLHGRTSIADRHLNTTEISKFESELCMLELKEACHVR
jgi:hypothetical protein